MSERVIRHMVCAVRSRPGGEETVQRAIEMALETEARLTFFQSVDLEFLAQISTGRTSSKRAAHEIRQMVDFTMTLLVEQAELQGVEQVQSAVREGRVRPQLLQFVAEAGADVLVLGRPRPDTPGPDVFSAQALAEFVAELEEVGTLEVIVL